jgi:hypothetical protein
MHRAGDNRIKYTKLSRRSGSAASHHRMWKGPDHLLVVKEFGCAEEYKRFYFNDIQAVVIVRTAKYTLWAILLPVLALFLVGFMFSAENSTFLEWLLGIVVVAWLIHLAMGPTCKCWLQTGINKERLLMYGRVFAANRFWKRIEPDLSAAQGGFSLEEMESEGTRRFVEPRDAPPPIPPTPQPEEN